MNLIFLQRDTLIRYLLDELYSYEEDHSDALCPIDREASRSHAGEAVEQRPMTTAEGREMFAAQAETTRTFLHQLLMTSQSVSTEPTPVSAHPSITMIPPRVVAPNPISGHSTPSSNHRGAGLGNFMFISPPTPFQAAPAATTNPVMKPFALIPDVPRGATGWLTVVKDWEEADPSRSLTLPLKDWPEEWRKRNELGSKYNQRRLIATEFIDE